MKKLDVYTTGALASIFAPVLSFIKIARVEKTFDVWARHLSGLTETGETICYFIMEGNKVRGQMQTCTIKTRKEDGNVIHMLAACASYIMASNIQFSAKIVDDNTIARIFPGMPDELSIKYSRCSM